MRGFKNAEKKKTIIAKVSLLLLFFTHTKVEMMNDDESRVYMVKSH